MTRGNALFQTRDSVAEAEADARADAHVRDGRLIEHDAVKRWLSSWGSPDPLPRPRVPVDRPAPTIVMPDLFRHPPRRKI